MNSTEKLQTAIAYAMANRPKVGGFPLLAECLRMAGVKHNVWSLPAAQSTYIMENGDWVINQGAPVASGILAVPAFDEAALITALRADQAGESTFHEFLVAAWEAGIVGYDVDFEKRTVGYMGAKGELYRESYETVSISGLVF